MAEKKQKTLPKSMIEKPPTVRERISESAKGSHSGKPIWGVARGKKK